MNRTVQAGYDKLAPRFGEWMAKVEGDPWAHFVEELASRLPEGSRVLDLGCGNGDKLARLAERFEVVGVDISEEQLRLAQVRVPDAKLLQGDFSELAFEDESFDAVTALYSIAHAPRAKHAELFARILRWLRPGGFLLASLGAGGSEDWTGEWLGVEMFFSSYDADTNRRLLREGGFQLHVDEVVTIKEPEGDATFLWVLAEKPR